MNGYTTIRGSDLDDGRTSFAEDELDGSMDTVGLNTPDRVQEDDLAQTNTYVCVRKCLVREDFPQDSPEKGILMEGQVYQALEKRRNSRGQEHIRCEHGWAPIMSSNGSVIFLKPKEQAERVHGSGRTIDWNRKPDKDIALEYCQTKRAMFKFVDSEGNVPQHKSQGYRLPIDPVSDLVQWKAKDAYGHETIATGFHRQPKGKVRRTDANGKEISLEVYPLLSTSFEDFGRIGGAGLRIYFNILLFLSGLFFLLGTTSLITISTFQSSDMYEHPDAVTYKGAKLVTTTLGNLRVSKAALDAGTSGDLWLAVTVDIANVCICIIALLMFKRHKLKIIKETDADMTSMSDYTVKLRAKANGFRGWRVMSEGSKDSAQLPFRHALKEYLESLPSAEPERNLKVGTVSEYDKDGKLVQRPAIWPAWDEDENISLWRNKVALLYTLEEAIAKTVEHQTELKQESNPTLYLKKPLSKLEGISKGLAGNKEHRKFKIVSAFVSFERATDQLHFIKTTNRIKSRAAVANPNFVLDNEYFQKTETNVSGKRAPEPGTLLWDNLEYTGSNRALRSIATNMICIILLLIGMCAIISANVLKESNKWTEACSVRGVLPGRLLDQNDKNAFRVHTFTRSISNGTNIFKKRPYGDKLFCDGLREEVDIDVKAWMYYREAWMDTVKRVKIGFPRILKDSGTCLMGRCCTNSSYSWSDANDNNCTRVDLFAEAELYERPFVFGSQFNRDAVCYACTCVAVPERNWPLSLAGFEYCKEFKKKIHRSKLFATLATVIVVVVNQFVKQALSKLVVYEKSHTSGAEQASLALKVFMAQFFNTACLLLILHAGGPFMVLPNEKYRNYNAKWCVQPLDLSCGCFRTCSVYWSLIFKYPVATITWMADQAASVPLVYGAGMPILYWVAAGALGLKFCVDKWAILRACVMHANAVYCSKTCVINAYLNYAAPPENRYANPPLYGSALFDQLERVLAFMLVAHCVFATYFYSVAGGVNPSESPGRDVTRPHVLPMLLASVGGVLGFAVQVFYHPKQKVDSGSESRLSDAELESLEHGDELSETEALPTFSDAIRTGVMCNERNDYKMNERRDLRQLELAMLTNIELHFDKRIYPFDDDTLAQKIHSAVKSPYYDDDRKLHVRSDM